jgi:hypothetical protein
MINFVRSLTHLKFKIKLFLSLTLGKDWLNNLTILRLYDYKFTFKIATLLIPRLRKMVVNQEDDFLKAFLNDSYKNEVAKQSDFKNREMYMKSLGKLWERSIKIDLKNLVIYEKKDILPKATKKYLKIKSPKIVNTKYFKNSFNYKVPVYETQVQTLIGCFANTASNSFIDRANKIVFVDEYSNRYPNSSDPKNEPFICGVRSNNVLVDSKIEFLDKSEYVIIDEGFWLCGIAFDEWAHFISTFLTKLPLMIKHPKWGLAPLIVPDNINLIQLNIITEVFGVKNILKVNQGHNYFIKKLYVVQTATYSPVSIRSNSNVPSKFAWVNPESFKQIELYFSTYMSLISIDEVTDTSSKVYWVRGSYGRRKLVNRSTLDELMESEGFDFFDPTENDFKAQLLAIKNADIIVAEMAAFIFLSFINPKCRIILLNSDWKFHMYPSISCLNDLRDVDIELLIGKRESTKDYKTENGTHTSWYLTDKKFEKLLKAIQIP